MHIIILYNNMTLSEVFWVGFYSSMIGFFIAIMASCYKSKCSKIDIGCIHIIRDVEGEEDVDRQSSISPISNGRL